MNSLEVAQYLDATFEGVQEALANPQVGQLLGARVTELTGIVERLVPVTNLDNPENMIELDDPNAIPLLFADQGNLVAINRGTFQMSSRQSSNFSEVIQSWQPDSKTPQEIEDDLALALATQSAPITNSINGSYEAMAGAPCVTAAVPTFATEYGLLAPPRGMPIARITFRTYVKTFPLQDTRRIEPDLLLHELTHVIQKEADPVLLFHSVDDVKNQALRGELEAYHVGACVRQGIEGAADFDQISEEFSSNPQIIVERARRAVNTEEDTFKPSRRLLNTLASVGIDRERIVGTDVDYDSIFAQLKNNARRTKPLPPKAKRSRRN